MYQFPTLRRTFYSLKSTEAVLLFSFIRKLLNMIFSFLFVHDNIPLLLRPVNWFALETNWLFSLLSDRQYISHRLRGFMWLIKRSKIVFYYYSGIFNSKSNFCRKIYKSSHQTCSIRKGDLRNFAKFTGKYLCQSLF